MWWVVSGGAVFGRDLSGGGGANFDCGVVCTEYSGV